MKGTSLLSKVWLITLREVAPYIGIVVLALIALFIIYIIIKWSRYWTSKAYEEYERQHPEVRSQD